MGGKGGGGGGGGGLTGRRGLYASVHFKGGGGGGGGGALSAQIMPSANEALQVLFSWV